MGFFDNPKQTSHNDGEKDGTNGSDRHEPWPIPGESTQEWKSRVETYNNGYDNARGQVDGVSHNFGDIFGTNAYNAGYTSGYNSPSPKSGNSSTTSSSSGGSAGSYDESPASNVSDITEDNWSWNHSNDEFLTSVTTPTADRNVSRTEANSEDGVDLTMFMLIILAFVFMLLVLSPVVVALLLVPVLRQRGVREELFADQKIKRAGDRYAHKQREMWASKGLDVEGFKTECEKELVQYEEEKEFFEERRTEQWMCAIVSQANLFEARLHKSPSYRHEYMYPVAPIDILISGVISTIIYACVYFFAS